ncbi:beta-propeller domain-containing protein [Pendulispora albinea]|uniref:Beta-propeller domain-containing protein n=1 Tax=Pendulispora albinea TaxID=2741071 RepID=A0ABZ2LWQ4_9BACT
MRKTQSLVWTAFFATVGSVSMAGCGDSKGGSFDDDPIETESINASLHRAKGCGDLLSDLKADLKFKVEQSINQQIRSLRRCLALYGEGGCAYGAYREGSMDSGGAGAPTNAGSGGDSKGGESATSYSQTNTQVKGVDEADFVKNDGNNIYVLHGRAFKVLKAWPAAELKEASTIDIEGQPSEMFVADGKVVIYSYVNGKAIFEAAGVKPKNNWRDYFYMGGGGVATDVGAGPSRGAPPAGDQGSGSFAPLTKITVLKLDGTTPQVAREVYFEGNYLDARRVGPHVRTVLQGFAYGPRIKYSYYELYPTPKPGENPYPKTVSETIAALGRLRAENVATIDASTLTDYLPYTFVKNGSAVSAQTVACEDFYVPTVGSTQSGIVDVASLDLDNPNATPKETVILGQADTVYGGLDTIYLASHGWSAPSFPWGGGGSITKSDGPALPVRSVGGARTHLHKFEFKTDPKFPNYQASGTVKGFVKNQFSLDDKDGYLRIATTESHQYFDARGRAFWPTFALDANGELTPDSQARVWPRSTNQVAVLAQNGASLNVVGKADDLAPNESIFSVRFAGSRGYVVTFRRVDPLFVFDLASPTNPKLLGALKIPGFSEYMHPIDENHILTIGRDADQTGRTRALQLQVFDVSDGAHPVQKHVFTYNGSEYGSTDAEYDHKAFTYFAEKKLLAFPYYAYGQASGVKSTLELFKIDVGAGISKVGSIDQSALVAGNPQGYCSGYYRPSVRRGIFMANQETEYVYSVSYGGVVVKNAKDLSATVSSLALSAPWSNPGYGKPCY